MIDDDRGQCSFSKTLDFESFFPLFLKEHFNESTALEGCFRRIRLLEPFKSSKSEPKLSERNRYILELVNCIFTINLKMATSDDSSKTLQRNA